MEVFYTVFRNRPGQRVFLTSGLGAMGYGLPAAIGACLANGRRPMVAVESDGSLQLNLQELATLRGQNLPICLVVMNNGGYASIRNTQRNYFEARYVGTGPEAGLWMPDLQDLARTAPQDESFAQALQASWQAVLEKLPHEVLAQAPELAALRQQPEEALAAQLQDALTLLGARTGAAADADR